MSDWLSNGGCVNGIRFAADGAGAGARDWVGDVDEAAQFTDAETIIVAIPFDSDDMNAIDGDFSLDWKNVSDAGSFAALSGSGELVLGTVSDLVNGNAVVEAEANGSENCSGMGVTRMDGVERENANSVSMSAVASKRVFDLHWAVDLSGADGANGDEYQFRVSENGSNSYKEFSAYITVVTAGKIDGITKNKDRSAAVGGVTVSAYRSDEAGSDPKPIGSLVSQVVSHASTGVYSLTGLISGAKYFLHAYKDDTADVSDGTGEVTAVDV